MSKRNLEMVNSSEVKLAEDPLDKTIEMIELSEVKDGELYKYNVSVKEDDDDDDVKKMVDFMVENDPKDVAESFCRVYGHEKARDFLNDLLVKIKEHSED